MFLINWERLDAGVFTSMLPATKCKSRTFATRETDVISERKHCSRRRRYTQVELSSSRKCADKTQTIARKRWHGARKRKRSNVRSTCGRLYLHSQENMIETVAIMTITHSIIWRPSRVADTPPLLPISWYSYYLFVADVSLCSEVLQPGGSWPSSGSGSM